jgi:dTDP-4-dehydrorhamnose reductase
MLKGFTNHRWNGITTLAFAKICHGIMLQGIELSQVQHITPLDVVSKYYLLHHVACFYGREDIQLDAVEAPVAVDRVLLTTQRGIEQKLWLAAEYAPRPSIMELVAEMAAYGRGDVQ